MMEEEWFVNLSSITFPREVQSLLQLGEKFSLPYHCHSRKHIIDFIKHLESNLKRMHPDISTEIRSRVFHFINKYLSSPPSLSSIEHRLIHMASLAHTFLNDHPNLLITKADKGNVTVVLDRDLYLEKMNNLLVDPDTYPVSKMLAGWQQIGSKFDQNPTPEP